MITATDSLALNPSFRFIYTDSVEIGAASVQALFHAANRYNIAPLCHLCLERMLEVLDPSNAAEFYLLARQHKHVELRKKSVSIIRESLNEVLATPGWAKLKAKNLLFEGLVKDVFSKKS